MRHVPGAALSLSSPPASRPGAWIPSSRPLRSPRSASVFSPRIQRPVHAGSSAAQSEGFPGLYAAPYIPATAANDPNGVYVSASGEFDGKGGVDIVTMQLDGMLNLLSNDGHGQLKLSYSNDSALAFSPNVVYLEAADLNNDGHLDLVALDAGNSAFLVFINNGDGTFASARTIAVAPASGASFLNGGSIAIGDVNGDGTADVVAISNLQTGQNPEYQTIFSTQTFLGKGDGTFAKGIELDTTVSGYKFLQYGQALSLADLNGDHLPDLTIEYADPATPQVTIAGCPGKGDGTFAAVSKGVSVLGLQVTNSTLQVADINNDGMADATFLFGDGLIYTALGNGSGGFANPVAAVSTSPTQALIRLGDFNGDGIQDLLLFSEGGLATYAGQGDGTFNAASQNQYGSNGAGAVEPVPADLDGDKIPDVVVIDSVYGTASVYRGLGAGKFAAQPGVVPANAGADLPNSSESPNALQVVATGTLSGSNTASILAADYTKPFAAGLSVYPDYVLGKSDGHGGLSFSKIIQARDLYLIRASGIAPLVADFNHDGYPDAIEATENGLDIALSSGGKPGPFQAISLPVETSGCSFDAAQAADINHDGELDLLIGYDGDGSQCTGANTPSGYFVLLGDGKGGFHSSFVEYGDFINQALLADLDGDGNLDLVADDGYHTSGAICYNCGSAVYALRGNGDGTFDTATRHPILDNWKIAGSVSGDFDVDGKQDLALLSDSEIDAQGGSLVPHTEGILLLRGHGDFTFDDPSLVVKDAFAIDAKFADLNADNKPELLFSVATSYQDVPTYFGLVALPNLGKGEFGSPINYIAPQSDVLTLLGDFNGDGAMDVLSAPAAPNGSSSVLFYNQAGTTVSLASSSTALTQGDPVALQASVATLPDTTPPAGTVSFSVNGTAFGNATLSDSGEALLQTSDLPVGTDVIVASYAGDSLHNAAKSQALQVTVAALAPSFTLTATPAAVTVAAGQSGTVQLNFAANRSFSGQVSVACSGLPAGASCTFSPSTLTLAAGKSGSINAVLTTAGATRASAEVPRNPWMRTLGSLAIVQCCLLLIPGWRSRAGRSFGMQAVGFLLIAGAFTLSGCGGDGHTKPGTPVGSSVVTITATATSGSKTLQQTAVVSLVVH